MPENDNKGIQKNLFTSVFNEKQWSDKVYVFQQKQPSMLAMIGTKTMMQIYATFWNFFMGLNYCYSLPLILYLSFIIIFIN